MTFSALQIQDYLACAYGTNATSAGDIHDSKSRGWFAVSGAIKTSSTENTIIILIGQCLYSTSFSYAWAFNNFSHILVMSNVKRSQKEHLSVLASK